MIEFQTVIFDYFKLWQADMPQPFSPERSCRGVGCLLLWLYLGIERFGNAPKKARHRINFFVKFWIIYIRSILGKTRENARISWEDYRLASILKICVHHLNHVTYQKTRVRSLKFAGFHKQSPSINYDPFQPTVCQHACHVLLLCPQFTYCYCVLSLQTPTLSLLTRVVQLYFIAWNPL